MSKYNFLSIARLPIKPFRKLYNWTISWSKSKNSSYALFIVAFTESSFFPIPPDVLLIPMIIGAIRRWFINALICLFGSLLGAVLGYYIGWGLYESVGKPIVDFYNLQPKMDFINLKFAQNAFWVIFMAAFTPIPYKVITISAGLFGLPISVLLFASLLGRGGRFFLVAIILRIYGPKIANLIEKYFDYFTIIFGLLLLGGFLIIKYLF